MAPTPRTPASREVDYPTTDGKPMGETDLHRNDMVDLITALEDRYADRPDVYVTGNLLLFYEEGNRRRHVSPDAFVAFGVPKLPPRDYYLLWGEPKGPDVVVEITSKTTRREDQSKKRLLYRDVLKVPEYFQFDPTEDYLRPSLQGHRLENGEYEPIAPVAGRLPSAVLGLHLERDGTSLRLFDPATGLRLPTRSERAAEARQSADAARRSADEALRIARDAARVVEETRRQVEEVRRSADEFRRQAEETQAENDRLRREVEELRRRLGGP